jgi:hypothetical protein
MLKMSLMNLKRNNNSSSSSSSDDDDNNNKSASVPEAATSGGGLPTWGLPQGRNIAVHPFTGPARGVKSSEAPHIIKLGSPLCVDAVFSGWWTRPTYTTSNIWTDKPDPAGDYLTLCCHDFYCLSSADGT